MNFTSARDHVIILDIDFLVEKPVKYFVIGEKHNFWQEEEQWPPKNTKQIRFYLKRWQMGLGFTDYYSKGKANSLRGDGELSQETPKGSQAKSDTFVYDPSNPGRQ